MKIRIHQLLEKLIRFFLSDILEKIYSKKMDQVYFWIFFKIGLNILFLDHEISTEYFLFYIKFIENIRLD